MNKLIHDINSFKILESINDKLIDKKFDQELADTISKKHREHIRESFERPELRDKQEFANAIIDELPNMFSNGHDNNYVYNLKEYIQELMSLLRFRLAFPTRGIR